MILWQNIFSIGFTWTQIYSLNESEHDIAVQGEPYTLDLKLRLVRT